MASFADDAPGGRTISGLMPFLAQEILLVSTDYDSFIIDEDGRFADRLISDYLEHGLISIPRLHRAATAAEALQMLAERTFHLVITMARVPDMAPPLLARRVKELDARVPVVLVTYDLTVATALERHPDWPSLDGVFVWKGDSKMLLALIKLVEDRLNAPHDTARHGVRVIIVVEDSPIYYSSFLPILYTVILEQTRLLLADGLNLADRLYKQRARPKVLLARTCEEALALYESYRTHVMAVVTDRSLPCRGRLDDDAGLRLVAHVRERDPELPILLNSATPGLPPWDERLQLAQVGKRAPDLLERIRTFIRTNCGFGDFVFRTPGGQEVARARTYDAMRTVLETVPAESLMYHARHDHLSRWLSARGEFRLAEEFRRQAADDFAGPEALRRYVVRALGELHERQQRGNILDFSRGARHLGRDFVRLGEGSLGGKGRGVAFIYKLIAHGSLQDAYPDVHVLVPRTTVVCTGEFERFVRSNHLERFLEPGHPDEEIVAAFLKARLSDEVHDDLEELLEQVTYPLAVRSSSLLEDSAFQPFAGVYATWLLPNDAPDVRARLRQLRRAIKLVYASTWCSTSRAFMQATGHKIEEEAMAVLIQRLVGARFGDRFYPTFSGVAQSRNYYPIRYMRPEDGIAAVALGLGRTVVQGGKALRFSPAHPQVLPQLASPEEALRGTQTRFWALAMGEEHVRITGDETDTLRQLDLAAAEADGALAWVGATYVPDEGRIYDTVYRDGPRLVTFAPVLKHGRFPLAPLLRDLLALGAEAMGCPVEIEFAVNMQVPEDRRPELAILQIRPLLADPGSVDVGVADLDDDRIVLRSTRALGHGTFEGLRDVVVVDPATYDPREAPAVVAELDRVNGALVAEGRGYVLLGPGRWGTQDANLGIPARWEQISAARVMVELASEGFDVDPSQGTHFFHNVLSLKVGYLAVDPRRADERLDWDRLLAGRDEPGLQHVRHVVLDAPLQALVDGSRSLAVLAV